MVSRTLPWLIALPLVMPTPALAAKRTEIRSLSHDPQTGALVVGYRGERPDTTTFRMPGMLVVDLGRIAQLNLRRRTILPARKDLYGRVRFSQRPHQVVRVVFDTPYRLDLKLLDEPGKLILQPYPLAAKRPASRPVPPRVPSPPPAEPPVEPPVEMPVGPSLPQPPAEPAPQEIPREPERPRAEVPPARSEQALPAPTLVRRLGLRAFTGSYRETYLPGDALVNVEGVDGLQGIMEVPLGEATGRAEVSRVSYGFSDLNLPLSAHFRDEWAGRFDLEWSRHWGSVTGLLGGGYGLRWIRNANTGAAPGNTFVFAGNQVYHGPGVSGGLRWEPVLGWEGLLRLTYTPWLIAHTDPGIILPRLMGASWEVGAARSWGSLRAEIGYRGQLSRGDQFESHAAGPYLGLSLAP